MIFLDCPTAISFFRVLQQSLCCSLQESDKKEIRAGDTEPPKDVDISKDGETKEDESNKSKETSAPVSKPNTDADTAPGKTEKVENGKKQDHAVKEYTVDKELLQVTTFFSCNLLSPLLAVA